MKKSWLMSNIMCVMLLLFPCPAPAGEGVVLYDLPGCRDMSAYVEALDYIQRVTPEQYKTFIYNVIASGKCTYFRAGEALIVSDQGVYNDMFYKVRRPGKFTEYFILINAVQVETADDIYSEDFKG